MRLPREELRRYIKETPFNRGEVLKLWTKFSYLDRDHSGYLALNVRLGGVLILLGSLSESPEIGRGWIPVLRVACILPHSDSAETTLFVMRQGYV